MARVEKDLAGTLEIPPEALYGIHALRAVQNFPDKTRFSFDWYCAVGTVKKAVYLTADAFFQSAYKKYQKWPDSLRKISPEKLNVLIEAATQVEQGEYFDQFIVPAVSGGAGTSINMNVNEIICNAALLKMGERPGFYHILHPIEDANIYQSTNDVIPTSLKVTVLRLLQKLEERINLLRSGIETIEKQHRNSVRIGRTQMQKAVPTSYGRLFSTYNEALSRDWWRVSKCFERIKTVNLGGSALGTGLTVPRYMIHESVQKLQQITGLPITKAENLSDQTSNLDGFVEVHAILKAHAVNLEKMSSDLRLIATDFSPDREVELPARQTGSSIMPGKINPVIPEYVVSAVHRIYANDGLISGLSGQGCLELNAYLPVIGHALIESLLSLITCNETLLNNLVNGLVIHEKTAYNNMMSSPGIATALLPFIGYESATEMATYMKNHQVDIFSANEKLNKLQSHQLHQILQPANLLKEGFTLNDIFEREEGKGE